MEGKLIEVRNWEDLNTDCLINIFGRVGLESLMFDIPFVCKSWYKASLDPHCWKILDFQFMSLNRRSPMAAIKEMSLFQFHVDFNNVTPSPQFMKIAVNRSAGLATDLVFHTSNLKDNILEYILERCPALKTLTLLRSKDYGYLDLEQGVERNDECLLKMIRKLPNLESLMTLIADRGNLESILNQIHNHCPNFVSFGLQYFVVDDDIASTLVTMFPNIKHLVLRGTFVYYQSLVLILSGCRKLELLDVSYYIGFDDDDADLLKLASHIKTFKVSKQRIV